MVLLACNMQSVYDESITIGNKAWYKDDLARFEVTIDDTLQLYDFYVNIRNTTDYRYSNLYIFMNTNSPTII